jgi:hypothetical protein
MSGNSRHPGKSRVRAVAMGLIFVIVILVAFAGVLEVVFRTTHLFGARISWAQPDPVLSWRYTPHATYWELKENPRAMTGRLNNYGYRDEDWQVQKPAGTYRIALLGDSYVEAMQVEWDSTFYRLAERRLNAAHAPKVEFMSFGRAGMSQTEELLVLKSEVMRFSPDMVILFFLPGNDIADVGRETAIDVVRPFFTVAPDGQLVLDTSFAGARGYKLRSLLTAAKQRSALVSFLAMRVNAYGQGRHAAAVGTPEARAPETLAALEPYLTLCTAHPVAAYVSDYALTKRLIAAMRAYCGQNAVRFMVVTIETQAYLPDNERKYKSLDPTFNPNFFDDDMGNFATSLGADYLGLERVFRQAYEERGAPLHWAHWNYAGHRVVATALADRLEPVIHRPAD